MPGFFPKWYHYMAYFDNKRIAYQYNEKYQDSVFLKDFLTFLESFFEASFDFFLGSLSLAQTGCEKTLSCISVLQRSVSIAYFMNSFLVIHPSLSRMFITSSSIVLTIVWNKVTFNYLRKLYLVLLEDYLVLPRVTN